MNLAAVAAEMRTALQTVPGLRAPKWGDQAARGGGDVALVGWPERLEPSTYGRGILRAPDWPVFLIVAGESRATHDRVAALLDTMTAGNAWTALEGGPYTTCDGVHVAYAEIDPAARYQGNPVVAAVLHADVSGKGK